MLLQLGGVGKLLGGQLLGNLGGLGQLLGQLGSLGQLLGRLGGLGGTPWGAST